MTSTMERTRDANPEPRDAAGPDDQAELKSPPDAEAIALVDADRERLPDAATLAVRRDEAALRTRSAAEQAGALAVEHANQALAFTDVSARRPDPAAPGVDDELVRAREADAEDEAAADSRGGDHHDNNGGDRGNGNPGEAGGEDDRGEEALRQAYVRFAADVASKRAAAEALGEPITVRVTDSSDISVAATQYETRFPLAADAAGRSAEDARYEALVRAKQIDDPSVQADLQQIEAYDDTEHQIVTRVVDGKRLSELTDEDKRDITETEIRGALSTIETMVRSGVIPNRDYGDTVRIHPDTHRLQFSDYEPIEQTDTDDEHPILTTGEIFMAVMRQFDDPAMRGRPEGAAGARIGDTSQHVLRDHFMYRAPHIAFNTEALEPDAIRTVYANTEPQRSTTAHDLHVASHMHDLALASDADVQTRLNLLGNAREAYEISIYQSVLDRRGDIHQVLRTDDRGRNQLLTNDHVLQARLALAFWPASEARIRGEALSDMQRQEINQNLAVVLGEMMPDGEAPEPSFGQQVSHQGFLGEVVAMTALSRLRPNVDTSLAIPTSEARRLYAGPDAAILFDDDGEYALDVDWKLRGEGGPDTVNVGNICYSEVAREPGHPYRDSDPKQEKDWRSVVLVAKLLHDEQLGNRPLTPRETAVLDRVQRSIWGVIAAKSRNFHGIDNLRQRARF